MVFLPAPPMRQNAIRKLNGLDFKRFHEKNVWKMMSANLQQHLTLVFRIDFMATGIFLKEEFSRKRKHNRVKIYLNKHCYFIHFVFHEIFMLYFQDLRMFHRNLVERLWDENKNAQSENILLHCWPGEVRASKGSIGYCFEDSCF